MTWNVSHMERPRHYSVERGLWQAAPFLPWSQVRILGHSDLLVDKLQDVNILPKSLRRTRVAEGKIRPRLVLSWCLSTGGTARTRLPAIVFSRSDQGVQLQWGDAAKSGKGSLMHFMPWPWCGVEDVKNTIIIFINAKDIDLVVVQKRITWWFKSPQTVTSGGSRHLKTWMLL